MAKPAKNTFTACSALALCSACAAPPALQLPSIAATTLKNVVAWEEEVTPTAVKLKLPERDPAAMSGSLFLEKTKTLASGAREDAIFNEIMAGNVPDFLRTLIPISLVAEDTWGRPVSATAWVMADYASIGSNADFVRIPMNLNTALRIARASGLALPTERIVDAVHSQASVRIRPRALPASKEMTTNEYFARHQRLIQGELAALHTWNETGRIVSGAKKDLIVSRRLMEHPGKLVIYGWHELNGEPKQPVSDVHAARYADYSHGVRFVTRRVLVNGKATTLDAALIDPDQAPAFSKEGSIESAPTLFAAAP